jgi:small subunit ribosomal protein S5
LRLAGIKDVWSKTFGQTRVKNNLVVATVAALRKLVQFKISSKMAETVGLAEGKVSS